MDDKRKIIAAFAFGEGAINHGRSNEAIAHAIEQYIEKNPSTEIFAQWEIAEVLEEMGVTVHGTAEKKADGTYLNSRDVYESLIAYLKGDRNVEIILAGHPGHVNPRLRLMARVLKLKIVWKLTSRIVNAGPDDVAWIEDVPFDKSSTQMWTRGPVIWWIHELLTLIHHLFKGWI